MADIVEVNPGLKKPILKILALVEAAAAQDRTGIEAAAAEEWSPAFRQGPSAVVDILVRNNALAEQLFVNGEPYPGTLEDVQRDENVPDDAEACDRLTVTEKGRKLLDRHAPANTLRALFESRPGYADVFQAMLWACDGDEGCTRADLEAQIQVMPQLQPDPATGRTMVYPQYFIDALETAGGIAWDGAWHTTAAGRAVEAAA